MRIPVGGAFRTGLASVWMLVGPAVALTALAADSPGPRDVPAEAVLADLPFQKWEEGNRIVIDLATEGARPLLMLLDTGASDSVLTPRYARKLGISVRPHKSSPYRRATRLGRDLQFWVAAGSSDTASQTGWEYGLLGGSFLEPYVIELDFAGRRVRFLDAARYRVPETVSAPDEVIVPLRIVARRPHADLVKDGNKVDVVLDTGAPVTALLSGAAAQRISLGPPILTGLRAAGVLGSTPMDLMESEGLQLGSEPLGKTPIQVAPRGFYNQGGSDDSLLGYDVLSRYLVRLDYPRSRLWLKRRPGVEPTLYGTPFEAARSAGVIAEARSQGLLIMSVLPDSPASKLGILPGDLLTPPPDTHADGFESALLARISRGEQIQLRRNRNGAVTELTLPEPPQ